MSRRRIALAPGHLIKYKLKQKDEWKTVKIVSKAGKTTGTFKNCYNVDYDGDRYYIDLDKVHNFERVFHTNEDNDITQDIRKNWTQLSSPIAFAGVTKIYNHYKEQISTKEIEHILSTIPTYTKYKQRKKSKLHNPFFLYYLHQQWQIDIIYFTQFKEFNDDIAYLLVVMECFSRKIFVAAMKSKSTTETLHHFQNIHTFVDRSPHSIYVDKGLEFMSVIFRK